MKQRLTDIGDLFHQERGRLQVPIGAGRMHVAQIGTEGDKVPGDGICVMRALFQGTDRERMTKIVNARPSLTGRAPQSY